MFTYTHNTNSLIAPYSCSIGYVAANGQFYTWAELEASLTADEREPEEDGGCFEPIVLDFSDIRPELQDWDVVPSAELEAHRCDEDEDLLFLDFVDGFKYYAI